MEIEQYFISRVIIREEKTRNVGRVKGWRGLIWVGVYL
jgi:hypothetical protein